MKKISTLIVFVTIANLLFFDTLLGQSTGDYRSRNNGDWNNINTWSRYNGSTWANATAGNGYPGQNAVPGNVLIRDGQTVTLNVSPANNIGSLTVEAGSNASTLTFSGNNSLTVNGAVTINSGTGNGDHKIIAVAGGTLTCASVTMATTAADNRANQITISTGTVTVSGDITMNSTGSIRNQIVFSNAGTLNINGAISTNGALTTATGSTVNYYGAAQTVKASTYHNLTLSGSGTKNIGTATVNGTLSRQGTATVSAAPTYGANAILEYKGSAAQITGNEFPATIPNLRIDNTSGAVTFSANKTITNEFNITTGSVANLGAGRTHQAKTLLFNGVVQAEGSWGHSNSAATNTNNTLFANSNGTINVTGPATYTWNLAGGGNWTTAGNWMPTRTTPTTEDRLIIGGTGAKAITNVPTQQIGRLTITGTTSVTLSADGGTQTLTIGDGIGDDLVVGAGASLAIATSLENVTLATGATADISGTYTNNSAFNLTNNNVVATINGAFINSATVNGATMAKLQVASGGTYNHALNGGTVPTATWHAASNLNITGMTSSYPSGMGQTFGNITFLRSTNSSVTMNVDLTTLGNFTHSNTGTGQVQFLNSGARTVTVGGDFTNISGNLVVNGGSGSSTLNVIGDFSLTSGNLVVNGGSGSGTLNVTGDFDHTGGSLVAVNGSGNGTLNITGNFSRSEGTFTLKGASGTAALNITGNFTQTGGTFNQRTSSTASTAIVTVGGNFGLTGGTYDISGVNAVGVLNVAGDFSVTGTSTFTETSSGSGSVNFTGYTNYTSSGTRFANTINFTVNSGATLMLGANDFGLGSIGTFTVANGGTIGIGHAQGITSPGNNASGNVRVTGTRNYNAGATYIYNGSTPQETGNGLPDNLTGNLTINNAAGVSLSLARTMGASGSLTFINGEFITTASNVLTFPNNFTGTITGANDNSYVSGPVRKTGASPSSFTFPIGKNGLYSPLTISNLNNMANGDILRAEYRRESGTALGPVHSSLKDELFRVSNCEYWTLEKDNDVGPQISASVTVGWFPTSGCSANGGYVTDITGITLAHFNGTTWDSYGGTSAGNPSVGTVTRTGVTVFSPFTLGSTIDDANPLPVHFDLVKAYSASANNIIEWTNETEVSIIKYEVERSEDGISFLAITTVEPRDNEGTRQSYQQTDFSVNNKTFWYRIKAYEMTGAVSYSPIVKVKRGRADIFNVQVYPNPVPARQFTLQVDSKYKADYQVWLVNQSGQQVFNTVLKHNGGTASQSIKLPAFISAGWYLLRVEGNGESQSIKVVLR